MTNELLTLNVPNFSLQDSQEWAAARQRTAYLSDLYWKNNSELMARSYRAATTTESAEIQRTRRKNLAIIREISNHDLALIRGVRDCKAPPLSYYALNCASGAVAYVHFTLRKPKAQKTIYKLEPVIERPALPVLPIQV